MQNVSSGDIRGRRYSAFVWAKMALFCHPSAGIHYVNVPHGQTRGATVPQDNSNETHVPLRIITPRPYAAGGCQNSFYGSRQSSPPPLQDKEKTNVMAHEDRHSHPTAAFSCLVSSLLVHVSFALIHLRVKYKYSYNYKTNNTRLSVQQHA